MASRFTDGPHSVSGVMSWVTNCAAIQHDQRHREGPEGRDVYRALLASGILRKTDPVAASVWSKQLEPVYFPPGHVVGTQSDFGGRLYVIISGKVKVSYRHPGGCEVTLTVLGPSEIFSAAPLFDPGSHETSVTTLSEVMAVPIDRRQLLAWIAQCPEVGAQMLRLFARWTKATTNCFIDFTFADVQSRVASRLLLLRKRFGHQEGEVVRVPRDLTWEDFSLRVGVSPEPIGETLCDFEDRGWIRLEDTSVVIVDAQSLTSVRVTSMSEVRCA